MRKETFVSFSAFARTLEVPASRIVYHRAFVMRLGTFALEVKLADLLRVL